VSANVVPPALKRRRAAEKRGRWAELLAELALRLKGYRILDRRYRTRLGEIDLIAKRGDIIAFVEVKARSDRRTAIDSVPAATQQRIRAASDLWIGRMLGQRRPIAHCSYRYDIVAVEPRRWPVHVPDAF
jgi:putative endonuclease